MINAFEYKNCNSLFIDKIEDGIKRSFKFKEQYSAPKGVYL